MGIRNFTAIVCSWFLGIYNALLLFIGIIITIRGATFYFASMEASRRVLDNLLGVDEYYRQVAMTYLLPGSIMIGVGIIGIRSSRIKVNCLFLYSGLLIGMIAAKIKNPNLSLYAYFNRISNSREEFGLFTRIAYPEYGMLIALLLSSIYLIYYHFYLQHLKEKIQSQAASRERLLVQNLQNRRVNVS